MKKAKAILKLIILSGVIIILGTAGSSDLGRITLLESISQVILGVILIFCGNAGLNLIKILKPAKRKRVRFARRKAYESKPIHAA